MAGSKGVVLITGASSGLGAGMARAFAKLGYDLALCARRLDRLEALKAELNTVRVEIRALDVADYPSVFSVFEDFRHTFGRLDRVIINAGSGDTVPVGKGGFAKNCNVLEINLIAALAQAEAAMEIFRAQNAGHLVVISSMSAMRGLRGAMTVYATSKSAVAHLAEGLRAETLRKPIDVTTIFPGYIESEMNEGVPRSRTSFIIDTETGCRLMARAIEARKAKAYVPW